MTLLSTAEAAARLGIPQRTVRLHITTGRLAAIRMGRDWFISPAAVAKFRKPKRGRVPAQRAAAGRLRGPRNPVAP